MFTINSSFPLWLLMVISPLIVVNLVANYLIDSGVIILMLKLHSKKLRRDVLLRTISMAWIMGFVCDIFGVMVLFLAYSSYGDLDVFNPTSNGITFIVFLAVISICGILVFFVDKYLFGRVAIDKQLSFKMAVAMGAFTAPWFFLIPSTLFY